MTRIAIFASGSGSNAEKICEYFKDHIDIEIAIIFTNNPEAGVIKRGRKYNIPTLVFDKKSFQETDKVLNILSSLKIDWVVLAGFMMLIPQNMVRNFDGKMLNIHPALLPKFGGKGMYGHFVHEAVLQAGETKSGITIHLVNEKYDEGSIVFQAECTLSPDDDENDIARKVQILEHQYYPEIIEKVIRN